MFTPAAASLLHLEDSPVSLAVLYFLAAGVACVSYKKIISLNGMSFPRPTILSVALVLLSAAGAIALGTSIAAASTTIGADINTEGMLSATGTSTLVGFTHIGPDESTLDPSIQGYTSEGGDALVVTSSSNIGVGIESQANDSDGGIGLYSVALQQEVDGGIGAFEGDAFVLHAGPGSLAHGYESFAGTINGTADSLVGYYAFANQNTTLVSTGFESEDQTVGQNANYGFLSNETAGQREMGVLRRRNGSILFRRQCRSWL